MSGIVTVTAAAAVDQTYLLPRLTLGAVNRAVSARCELSGKGLNVGRAVALTNTVISAVLAVGDHERQAASELGYASIVRLVPVPGRTRVNTTIVGESGQTTKLNEAPIPMTAGTWQAICDAANAEIDRLDADWLVLCGSVPTLVGSDELVSFTTLLKDAAARGVRVAVDTSGLALEQLVRDLSGITLIKPNAQELADVVGRSLSTVGDVIAAAEVLRDRGCDVVFVSLGEDGAVAVSGDGVWWARAQPSAVVNATGAGDASMAGFLVHAAAVRDASGFSSIDVPRALAGAASWGALSVSQPTTLLSTIEGAPIADVAASPDPARKLADPALRPMPTTNAAIVS